MLLLVLIFPVPPSHDAAEKKSLCASSESSATGSIWAELTVGVLPGHSPHIWPVDRVVLFLVSLRLLGPPWVVHSPPLVPSVASSYMHRFGRHDAMAMTAVV